MLEVVAGNRTPQLGESQRRGVVDAAPGDAGQRRIEDRLRRREVRLADLHVNDAAPSRLERACRGLNLHDVEGRDVAHARGKVGSGIHRKSECRFGKR